jgi:hypothetical protein
MATGNMRADTAYENPCPHATTRARAHARYPQRARSHARARNPRIADIRGHTRLLPLGELPCAEVEGHGAGRRERRRAWTTRWPSSPAPPPPAVRLQASGGRRYREGGGPAVQTRKRIGIREGGCAG